MLLNQLTLAYECLSAIGNSLEFESMILEILSSFSRKTGAINARYYADKKSSIPMFSIGKKIAFEFDKEQIKMQKYILVNQENLDIIILPLKDSYLLFAYKNQKEIKQLATMLGNFQTKINLSISACMGVQNLNTLNDELEERVKTSVNEMREKDKMLMAQSKQAVMGEMIEMIAHQWRQPLTAIGMISNNIAMEVILEELNPTTLQEDLHAINAQVNYLSTTIDDFRNFFKESKERVNVSSMSILKSINSLVYHQLKSQNISISIKECQDKELFLYKNELMQAILNLISNAKDALLEKTQMQEKKRIILSCKSDTKYFQIVVEDNAGGIPDEIISKIFNPYFSTKKEKNGTGLGLYMSKIIIQEHLLGKLSVENGKEGAHFYIKIPLKENKQ